MTSSQATLAANATFLLAGSISLAIGTAILFFTSSFYASTGISLGAGASLPSEIRAAGAALFSVAIFLLVAIAQPGLRQTALGISAVYFLAYGSGRLLTVMLDGWPHPALIAAMTAELSVGLISLVLWQRMRRAG